MVPLYHVLAVFGENLWCQGDFFMVPEKFTFSKFIAFSINMLPLYHMGRAMEIIFGK